MTSDHELVVEKPCVLNLYFIVKDIETNLFGISKKKD